MESTYRVRNADGSEYGPVELDALRQWAIQGRIATSAMIVPEGGGEGEPAGAHPAIASILSAPPTVRGSVPEAPRGDATGGLIPYKNPPALTAYYVGICAWIGLLVPPLGVIVGVVAVVLGIKGLRLRAREPEVKGSIHAWVGILSGGLVALLGLVITVIIAVSMITGA